MKNKVIKTIFSLAIAFAMVMFAGCTHSDDTDAGAMIGNIEGMKASYRPVEYPVTDFYENFSKQILVELAKIFGQAEFPTNQQDKVDIIQELYDELYGNMDPPAQDYVQFEQNYRIYFLDDIRSTVYLYSSEDQKYSAYVSTQDKWKWTIGSVNDYEELEDAGLAGIFFVEALNNLKLTAANAFSLLENENMKAERNNFYLNYYANKYTKNLQVAILQILLGKTPTQFVYNFDNNTVTPNANDLLEGENGLKKQYAKYTTYIGISFEQDIPKITNYILDNVIGSQKYNNANGHFSREDYKNIIEQVIWNNTLAQFSFSDQNGPNQQLGSIYSTYPALVVKDYSSNSFFISSRDGHAFDHIPSGAYQSIVLMPSQVKYLSEIWFFLVSEKTMNIKYHYRYYDAETDTYYVSSATKVTTTPESQFLEEESPYAGIIFKNSKGQEILYKTQPFNNQIGDGVLAAAGTEKIITQDGAQYFKIIPSANGFGSVAVLNEDKFRQDNSSYFEIVFDVEKDPAKPEEDYSFKVGMYALWFASEQMVLDFLWQQQNS